MKKTLAVLVAVVGIGALAAIALAQSHGGHGGGMGEGMGQGMMGGQKMGGHSAMHTTTQITEDKAKELAQQYADKNLAGFKVERVLPSTGMPHTMYSVELKNPNGELRSIHITPFGGVMPFSGPAGHSQGHS
jgi:hypothetical protein